MGTVRLIPIVKDNDWSSLRQALAKLASKLGPSSAPEFSSLTLSDLTASRLVQVDADNVLASVADFTEWITGTANQIVVADDGDGSLTLSLPQDIHTGASPTFAGLTSTGIIDASTGEILVEDNDISEPIDKDDGYIGVAIIGGQPRLYFTVNSIMYYITADAAVVSPTTGNPIGLLLLFTYV